MTVQRSHAILVVLIFLTIAKFSNAQFSTITCYECSNCTDPFTTSSSVTTPSSCYACFKLSITVDYAPYKYIVRKCLRACIETSQTFGGGSITSTCCTSNLCNSSPKNQFTVQSQFLLMFIVVLNFIKRIC